MASRVLTRSQWAVLMPSLRQFSPDVVWQDGLYPYVTADRAAKALGVPRFYRSHNIEHMYMARQVAKATSWRDKLAWGLNLPHLKRVERAAIAGAAAYFDISTDDLAYWQAQGMERGHWLPPLIDPVFANRLSAPRDAAPLFDVGYLGNLHAPNNVEGILWFVNEVMPRLRSQRPEIRVMVAGSQPTSLVRDTVRRSPGVTLLENAPDVVRVLRDARVLVNPVFVGSGVNVKSVEMLFAPAHLVSAPQGVVGLPAHVQACFAQAQTADAFAEAVLMKLNSPDVGGTDARLVARAEFGFDRIQQVVNVMETESRCEVAA
jgi:glycosyltransferase involved in cell wall biosynthesis